MPSFHHSVILSALFVLAPLASAQDEGDTSNNRGVWSLTSENDLFGGTDRNYTNGVRIERVSPANDVFPVRRSPRAGTTSCATNPGSS